jgi:hypothetical protein
METPKYTYWKIIYISCEGNERWKIAITPIYWSECDVKNSVPIGGCGDDVDEVVDVFETSDTNYSWILCD